MNDQVTKQETATILDIATQALEREGDFVELGCYKGDTSVLLGKMLQNHSRSLAKIQSTPQATIRATSQVEPGEQSPDGSSIRKLWIYDSFAGLPAKSPADLSSAGQNFQEGELFVTKREVVDKIRRAGLHNVIVKKAWFDELASSDLPAKIAFAFLDGDLYESIKTSLKLVVPRLAAGAQFIVHDYNNPELPGASRAVDEFLHAHPDFSLKLHYSLAILARKC